MTTRLIAVHATFSTILVTHPIGDLISSRLLMRTLDRQAFANAYVAGLKEDIKLKGNEYSILLSLFTAGFVSSSFSIYHANTL
jgi:hypothetical protein